MPRFHIPQSGLQFFGVGLLCAAISLANSTAFAQQPDPPNPNGALPNGFRPNPPIPEQIEDEKITKEEYSLWKKKGFDYQKAIQTSNLKTVIAGQTAQDWIVEGARIHVSRLSQKSNRNELTSVRAEVTRELSLHIKTQLVRDFYIDEIVKNCQLLLVGNLTVRMHALKLIGELNTVEAGIGLRGPPAIASHAGLPVLKSVVDATVDVQPEAVKIFAARSIIRILVEGRVPTNDRTRDHLATSLAAEIEQQRDAALERVLVNALVETELPLVTDANNKTSALVVFTLTRVVLDRSRSYTVRCEAADALGRAPLPGGVNGQVLAYAVAQLAGQLAADYNTGKVDKRFAVFRFQNIFFALRGRAGESTTDGKSASGLTNTSKHADLNSLHSKHVLPMASTIYSAVQGSGNPPNELSPQSTDSMLKWPKPTTMVLHGNGPPVDQGTPPQKNLSAQPAGDQAGP